MVLSHSCHQHRAAEGYIVYLFRNALQNPRHLSLHLNILNTKNNNIITSHNNDTMQFQYITTLLAFTGAAMALPTANTPTKSLGKREATQVLLEIMPSSSSCAGRGDECRTATQAASYLVQAMTKYKATTDMEQAGILALVAYESEEMRYKKNLNNAAAGQGTSNM